MKHKVDQNDLLFVKERFGQPLGWCPNPRGKHGEINPHVTTFFYGTEYISVFHIKPVYYEDILRGWIPLSDICTWHGNRKIRLKPEALSLMSPRYLLWLQKRQKLFGEELLVDYGYMGGGIQPKHLVFATTSTFYPDPDVETTTVDGLVSHLATASTWDSVHDATTGTGVQESSASIYMSAELRVSTFYEISRGFYLFDTSAISINDTITSASFGVAYAGDKSTDDTLTLIQTSPASNTALTTDDFDALTVDAPTEGGARVTPTATASNYDTFILNANGISWIDKNGITKLGIRFGRDTSDTTPIGTTRRYYSAYTADQAGTTTDPKLIVIHNFTNATVSWFSA